MQTVSDRRERVDTVIVPALQAYPEYLRYAVYACQAGRFSRQEITHLGFYTCGAIQPHIPRIDYVEDYIAFTSQEASARASGSKTDRHISQIIGVSLRTGIRTEGVPHQVFLLSPPESNETVRLTEPIVNDTISKSGRRCAWARSQRYVSLAILTHPGMQRTSQIDQA